MPSEHPRSAVEAPLLAFAYVVQEPGGDQVRIEVAAVDQPSRSFGAVHDVARVLSLEQRHQRLREPLPREGEVRLDGVAAGVPELAQTIGDHVKSSSVPGANVRMNQRIGLYCGATKPMSRNVIRMPIP